MIGTEKTKGKNKAMMISKEHKLCERKCDQSIRGDSAMNVVIINLHEI